METSKLIKLKRLALIAAIATVSTIVFACKSNQAPIGSLGAEKVFEKAMKEFEDKDYLEAEKLFEVIRLQYGVSQYAAAAQYYLAEIKYNEKQYVLSAFNFSYLKKAFPQSKYARLALFKSAMSYYQLSPEYDRDQEYTQKAIQAFSEFQTSYPDDSLFKEANKYIVELRDKLALREYFTATLYRKIYAPKASLIYYDSVIEDYSDTKYYESALYGKADVLIYLGRKEEARPVIDQYLKLFPKGDFATKMSDFKKSIEK